MRGVPNYFFLAILGDVYVPWLLLKLHSIFIVCSKKSIAFVCSSKDRIKDEGLKLMNN